MRERERGDEASERRWIVFFTSPGKIQKFLRGESAETFRQLSHFFLSHAMAYTEASGIRRMKRKLHSNMQRTGNSRDLDKGVVEQKGLQPFPLKVRPKAEFWLESGQKMA